MNKQIKNYQTKPINEFNSSDTLFITKMVGNFSYTFLVEFESFDKGMVSGKILEIQPNNTKHIWINGIFYRIGDSIKSRINKCYTFGDRCYWFEKFNNEYICK